MDINPAGLARLAKRQQNCRNTAKKAAVTPSLEASPEALRRPENPYIGRPDNGPYHLGHLLREHDVPRVLHDQKSVQLAEAMRSHAENGANALLHGMAAIGALMIRVGATREEGGELGSVEVLALGDLIQHMAVELRFLNELSGSMEDSLHERELAIAKGGVQ